MVEAATIARPYAKAAYLAARDAKALPAWSEALRLGSELIADPRIEEIVGNPNMSIDQVVSMFAGLGGSAPGLAGVSGASAGASAIDPHWQNFVRLLAQNKRLYVLPDIMAQFEMLRARYEHELDVQVTSAVTLSEPQQSALSAALRTRFKCDVRMTTSVDPALLGGAVIRAGDLVIDGSIHGRLQRLASALTH